MKKFIFKDWKTNVLAFIALVVLVAYIFGKLTTEQLVTVQGFLGATGLFLSKDAGKDEPEEPNIEE